MGNPKGYSLNERAIQEVYENISFRFSNEADNEIFRKLNNLFRKVKSFREFYSELQNISQLINLNKNHLESEYSTANRIVNSKIVYNRFKNSTEIFPFWTLKSDICDRHKKYESEIIISSTHNIWSIFFPSFNWCCECHVVPRMASQVVEIDNSKMIRKLVNLVSLH